MLQARVCEAVLRKLAATRQALSLHFCRRLWSTYCVQIPGNIALNRTNTDLGLPELTGEAGKQGK